MQASIGIGILGCGVVGGSLARRLLAKEPHVHGVEHTVHAIAVRSLARNRGEGIPPSLLIDSANALLADHRIDLVVETMGGTTLAAEFVERALERGCHVVTANKALIGSQGPRLHALAARRGASLRYEAAVGGALPILRTIDEALAGDPIESFVGVLNGTCNAILSAMERGGSFEEALADAQRAGFAEADPGEDIDGLDSAHKLAVLVQRAFGAAAITPRLRFRGIRGIDGDALRRYSKRGYRMKLLAAARRDERGIAAEVAPALVPREHPLGALEGAQNGVLLRARDAGELYLRGVGAGGPATSSAILGDIADVLRGIVARTQRNDRIDGFAPILDIRPIFPDTLAIWNDGFLASPETRLDAAHSSSAH